MVDPSSRLVGSVAHNVLWGRRAHGVAKGDTSARHVSGGTVAVAFPQRLRQSSGDGSYFSPDLPADDVEHGHIDAFQME